VSERIRKSRPKGGFFMKLRNCGESALTRLETRVGFADHEDLATAANHFAVAVTGLRRLQRGQDLHDEPRMARTLKNWKSEMIAGKMLCDQALADFLQGNFRALPGNV
jgi:hypothetical protein